MKKRIKKQSPFSFQRWKKPINNQMSVKLICVKTTCLWPRNPEISQSEWRASSPNCSTWKWSACSRFTYADSCHYAQLLIPSRFGSEFNLKSFLELRLFLACQRWHLLPCGGRSNDLNELWAKHKLSRAVVYTPHSGLLQHESPGSPENCCCTRERRRAGEHRLL